MILVGGRGYPWKSLPLTDWDKLPQQKLYLLTWSPRPPCSPSDAHKNSSGMPLILLNWPAQTLNPGENLVKSWWPVEIKKAKQTATKQMSKWCFFCSWMAELLAASPSLCKRQGKCAFQFHCMELRVPVAFLLHPEHKHYRFSTCFVANRSLLGRE